MCRENLSLLSFARLLESESYTYLMYFSSQKQHCRLIYGKVTRLTMNKMF